ncbi:hypothetical protein FHU43_2798 [Halopolyspora algeriensis]|nr:hypothetical protein FHU43_2798 [Halopolyspora algeriensis]
MFCRILYQALRTLLSGGVSTPPQPVMQTRSSSFQHTLVRTPYPGTGTR